MRKSCPYCGRVHDVMYKCPQSKKAKGYSGRADIVFSIPDGDVFEKEETNRVMLEGKLCQSIKDVLAADEE